MTPPYFFNGGIHGEMFGDKAWLIEQIDQLPIRMQKRVSERYGEIYLQLVDENSKNIRYRANCWMRATVKKYKVVDDGIIPF